MLLQPGEIPTTQRLQQQPASCKASASSRNCWAAEAVLTSSVLMDDEAVQMQVVDVGVGARSKLDLLATRHESSLHRAPSMNDCDARKAAECSV